MLPCPHRPSPAATMSVRRERKSTRRYLDPPSPERPRTATPSGTPRASRLAVLPVVGEHHPSGDATGAASPGKAGKRNGRIAVQGGGTEDAAAIAAPHGARDKTDEEDQVNEAWDDFAAEYFEGASTSLLALRMSSSSADRADRGAVFTQSSSSSRSSYTAISRSFASWTSRRSVSIASYLMRASWARG